MLDISNNTQPQVTPYRRVGDGADIILIPVMTRQEEGDNILLPGTLCGQWTKGLSVDDRPVMGLACLWFGQLGRGGIAPARRVLCFSK